jgi:hypothetical protein
MQNAEAQTWRRIAETHKLIRTDGKHMEPQIVGEEFLHFFRQIAYRGLGTARRL